jgi:branched-chain amino acid aminotransferase
MSYFTDDTVVFYNGEWINAKDAQTSVYAQTLHYGNAVFEGIRAYATDYGFSVFKAKEHYERLEYSAKKMYIPFNYSVETLVQLTYQLLEKNGLKDAYIRPLIFPDPNMSLLPVEKANVFISAWKWERYLGSKLLNLTISPYQRPNPKSCHVEAKVSGHYTNSILATTEAKHRGYDEALLLDMHGFLAEGPGANLFFEKDETLYTPALGNILPGITRATIMELAESMGYNVVEGQYKPEELLSADSAFYTGTAAEVAGIASVNDVVFPLKWEDSIGYQLSAAYQQLVVDKSVHNLLMI